MSSAMGILGWPPEVFWNASFFEYSAAMKGYLARKGIKPPEAVTQNDFLDMVDEAKKNPMKAG